MDSVARRSRSLSDAAGPKDVSPIDRRLIVRRRSRRDNSAQFMYTRIKDPSSRFWVKMRNTRREQMFSAVLATSDIRRDRASGHAEGPTFHLDVARMRRGLRDWLG